MWKLVRIWILSSWSFLTIGILLGSWWAYHELGWGGWWFWDPVENASLMPWLIATACIHSITKSKLNYWTLICTQTTFILSILGTFFVRSGLLSSVHSFATDSTRGFYLLLFLLSITAISVFNWISLCFNISKYERLWDSQNPIGSLLASNPFVESWKSFGSIFRLPRSEYSDSEDFTKQVDSLTHEDERGASSPRRWPPRLQRLCRGRRIRMDEYTRIGRHCLILPDPLLRSFERVPPYDFVSWPPKVRQASYLSSRGSTLTKEAMLCSLRSASLSITPYSSSKRCRKPTLSGETRRLSGGAPHTLKRTTRWAETDNWSREPKNDLASANSATTPVFWRKQSAKLFRVEQCEKRVSPKGGSSSIEIKKSLEQILFLQNFYLCIICIVVFCGTSAPLFFQWLWDRDVGTGAPFYNAICIPLFTSIFFVLVYVHYIQFNISNMVPRNSPGLTGWVVARLTEFVNTNFSRPANPPKKGCSGFRVDTLLFLYCIFCLTALHVFIGVQLIGLNFLDSVYAAICFLLISSIILSSLLRTPYSCVNDTFMNSLSSLPSRHLVVTPKDPLGHEPNKNRLRLFQFDPANNNSCALPDGPTEIRKECKTIGSYVVDPSGSNVPNSPPLYGDLEVHALGSKNDIVFSRAPFSGIRQFAAVGAMLFLNNRLLRRRSCTDKELHVKALPSLTANNCAFFVFGGPLGGKDPTLRVPASQRTKEECLIPSLSQAASPTQPPELPQPGGSPDSEWPDKVGYPLSSCQLPVGRCQLPAGPAKTSWRAPNRLRDGVHLNRGRIKVLPTAPLVGSSLQMNLAHTGVVLFITGILLSNTFKFEFTEQLHPGPSGIRLGSQICCLRSIDHSFAPTYHSICANLLVYQQVSIDGLWLLRGPSAFSHKMKQVVELLRSDQQRCFSSGSGYAVCMFPEKRFYYSNQSPQSGPNAGGLATKVAIHSNLFTDLYSLIGTGSFETGWFTTIMKLPFICCIWLGFIFGVIGGLFSLNKQLQKSKLYWF